MKSKYYNDTYRKTEYFVFTESQLRDYEILVIYRTLVGEGTYSSTAIRKLANEYNISTKSVEKVVYPTNV